MLNIDANLFGAFSKADLQASLTKLSHVLQDRVPELRDQTPDQMMHTLQYLHEQAIRFGLSSEQSIAAYCITAAQLGIDFPDQFPGARQILEADLTEKDKSSYLEAFTLNLLEILEE